MTVETAAFISQLDATYPASGDLKSEGDNHLRLIKTAVKGSFPNLTAVAVTATSAELNYVTGVTSGIQAQINAEAATRLANDNAEAAARIAADALKADLANPTFTGVVTIPPGASIDGFAPLASPALTGTPTAPTAAPTTATTQIATTAMVQSALTAYSGTNLGLPTFTGADANKSLRLDSAGASYVWVNEAAATETLTNKTLTGYTETVYALSGTVIDPANGTVQTKTLSANTTFTESLADGQNVILGITAGAYSVTWPSTTWAKVGGSGVAPTLTSTGVNWVVLWQVGGVLRGSFLGTA